jgi:hypothetical protein
MDLQELGGVYMNDEQVKKYFKNLVPNYEGAKNNAEQNKNYYNQTRFSNPNPNSPIQNNSSGYGDANQVLVEKLNYMINLLEDQQDERTNNVTEEVVLYSFLGVFIIFVVDSFARALEKVVARLGVVDNGGRRGGAALGLLGRARRVRLLVDVRRGCCLRCCGNCSGCSCDGTARPERARARGIADPDRRRGAARDAVVHLRRARRHGELRRLPCRLRGCGIQAGTSA